MPFFFTLPFVFRSPMPFFFCSPMPFFFRSPSPFTEAGCGGTKPLPFSSAMEMSLNLSEVFCFGPDAIFSFDAFR
ncbi:hypothetical protein RchiOBHm_Chr4g0424761 [Rosa chinensis]|uniref:Uncharacterized protein n=1 Tax=Rosa chinensis TaxID=74649 RepID=A0A2P6QYZ6_ROSCH|nr:hypothetical protein RchiOBHm_Chr4g0424761 [Rosa chinensis]